jgi:rod shape determining protein RodA
MFQIDRRLAAQVDWVLLGSASLLVLFGLATIYSATHASASYIYDKHVYWIFIGSAFFLAALALDYSLLERFAYPVYGFSLLLLIGVIVFGRTIAGAKRWIDFGFISIQPSEFAKLALIVALAKYFSDRTVPDSGLTLKELAKPVPFLLVPFLLVAKQPDLGTALILMLIFSSMVMIVKVKRRVIIGLAVAFAPLVPIFWASLKGYQKARIISFIDPSVDKLGTGYHLLQSKIAIGSGGFMGKGYLEGTQGKLRFLPEHHTDFIFPTLAEEWGFVGAIIFVALFLILITRGIDTAKGAKDRFGFLVAFGVSAMLFWHAFINIGMVCGLMPVVGVPLPFLSYGGSFLATSLIGVGLLANIGMRRFIF